MPSGQFNTVVISVSDILPLDKGHYISVIKSIIFPIGPLFPKPPSNPPEEDPPPEPPSHVVAKDT